MSHRRLLAALTTISLLAITAAPVLAQEEDRPLGPPDATPNPAPLEVPAGDGTAVRLVTELGDIVIGLFNESAPVAAENFLNLAESGFYDGIGFHRSRPGFVLQGGDPDGDGTGGPGYTISDEEVVGRYGRGVVAMARTDAPDSQGSQFFIVLDDEAEAPLESRRTYTIFGRVVEGMDVVDAIVEAREPADRVPDPVRIIETSVEQVELPPEPTPEPPTAGQLAAEELATRLPAEAAGYQLQQAAFTLDDVAAQLDPGVVAELQEIATANEVDPGLISIAQAIGDDADGFVSVLAISIPGVPADQLVDAAIRLLVPAADSSPSERVTIADREVQRIDLAPEPGPGESAYVLQGGDVVWFLVSTLEDNGEVIAALE